MTDAINRNGEKDEAASSPSLESIVSSLRKFIIAMRADPPTGVGHNTYMASMIALERGVSLLEGALEGDSDLGSEQLFRLEDVALRRLEQP